MKKLSGPAWLAITTSVFAVGALSAGVAVAQEGADEAVEEIVTLGTRRQGRTSVDTAVPVDVFSADELERVSSDDLIDVIKTLVPSFNVGREPISDGGSFVRPPQMRGLDSDKTLVLVNGKRRHRAALVQLGGFGSHGPDLATIPSISLRSVEILRDGASALYGSDAIAGVMNFNLKNSAEGGSLRVQSGQYNNDNEASFLVAANVGLPIGDKGFVNISVELSDAEPTSRGQNYSGTIADSGQRPIDAAGNVGSFDFDYDGDGIVDSTQQRFGPDALTEVYDDAGNLISLLRGSDGIYDDLDGRYAANLPFAEIGSAGRGAEHFAQVWGEPERNAIRSFVNAGYDVTDTVSLYGWFNYSDSNSNTGFFHRDPDVSQLAPIRTPDGAIFNPRTQYPGGFTPRFFGNVIDQSYTGGVKGEWDNGMTYDFGGRYGSSEIRYQIKNTRNPSLGPLSPTKFSPGNLISDEVAFSADFTMDLDLAQASTFAFGFEWREEGYEIEAGDPASVAVGPYASVDPWDFETTAAEDIAAGGDGTNVSCRIPGQESATELCIAGDPINTAVPVGSNGFPGFGPQFTSDFERDSWAVYADLETDISDALLLTAAARYEDYGNGLDNFSFRVAGRFNINDQFTIRGSAGTGFRAPTPGQISTTNVSTRIADDGTPVAEGIFPPDSAAAQIFGATSLDAEESLQFTLGLAATPTDGLTITLDYYFIELTDRLILSSDFEVTPAIAAQLEAAGVPGANTIAQVSFFTNDVDTETQGIDLVATYDMDWGGGVTTFSVSGNWNDTEITKVPPHINPDGSTSFFLSTEDIFDQEHGLPSWRSVLGLRHTWSNDLSLNIRGNWYGDYENTNNSDLDIITDFDSVMQVDLDLTWMFDEGKYGITVGGNNIFDNMPTRGGPEATSGRIWRSDTVSDWQGTFYYVRGTVNWD